MLYSAINIYAHNIFVCELFVFSAFDSLPSSCVEWSIYEMICDKRIPQIAAVGDSYPKEIAKLSTICEFHFWLPRLLLFLQLQIYNLLNERYVYDIGCLDLFLS
ncbi:hypothetical protein Ancab_030101 [Ancistrocladus abbreviatus]